jgi:hypothetical protein
MITSTLGRISNKNNLLLVAPEFENKFAKYTTNDYQEEIYLAFWN